MTRVSAIMGREIHKHELRPKGAHMQPQASYILTVNAGSSSIKFDLFETGNSFGKIVSCSILNIGQPSPHMEVIDYGSSDHFSHTVAAANHAQATEEIVNWLHQQLATAPLVGIGHRIVHGGPLYVAPVQLDSAVIEKLRGFTVFDPLHMPLALDLAATLQRIFPEAPHIACFDTAFHHELPTVSRLLPIPRQYETRGIRRYGFHGLSYTFVLKQLRALGGDTADGKIVIAHLGSGASMTAVHYGKPIDTTMALTPASGIPMSTRSGDIDPGLASYLTRSEQMTTESFADMTSSRSGLLGISETSADMKQLLEMAGHDPRAQDAIDIFCYNVRKTIGAYAAALGGLDTVIFTGGMGEKAPRIRAQVCADLTFLGIVIDDERNMRGDAVISADDSKVVVRVVPTDEASTIAEAVQQFIQKA